MNYISRTSFLLVTGITPPTVALTQMTDPFAIAGIHLGKTTQTNLATLWGSSPQIEVGEHPHSARQWHYSNARIDTDGRRYIRNAVIIDTVQISAWKGDLRRFLTGNAFPEWMKNLRFGDARHLISDRISNGKTDHPSQAIVVHLSGTRDVSLRFSARGLVALGCSLSGPTSRSE